MSIHRLGLDDPRGKVLLPQCPENRNEGDRNQNVEEDFSRLFVENFARIRSHADRRNMNKLFAAQPKNERGDGHEDTGKSKSDVRTVQARTLEKTDNRWWQFGDEAIRSGFVGLEQPGNQ